MESDGHPWSVAVSRPWYYMVRGTSSHEPVIADELLRRILTTAPSFPVEVQTAALVRWAGEATGDFTEEGLRPGVILGGLYDLRRLAYLLHELPFPRLTIWDGSRTTGVRSLFLEARGKWRGVLAAMDGDHEDAPVLDFAESATR